MADPRSNPGPKVSERELREAELTLTTPAPKTLSFGGFVAAPSENDEPPAAPSAEAEAAPTTEESAK